MTTVPIESKKNQVDAVRDEQNKADGIALDNHKSEEKKAKIKMCGEENNSSKVKAHQKKGIKTKVPARMVI